MISSGHSHKKVADRVRFLTSQVKTPIDADTAKLVKESREQFADKKLILGKPKRNKNHKGTTGSDQTKDDLIEKNGVPKTMFGGDKEAKLKLTRRQHEEFQRSHFS
jgi:hypothetical protein